MIIYQVYELQGQWEDYREWVVGTYLYRKRAERELARLKAKVPDCDDCPYSEEGQEVIVKTDCPFHHPTYRNYPGYEPYYVCTNCVDSYDAPEYCMREYEVDESEE